MQLDELEVKENDMLSGASHHIFKEEKTQEKPLRYHMLVMVTKKGQVGSNGLQPTMGPSRGWAWRLLADEDAAPFNVLSLPVDKLEAAAGQPPAARGPATSPPPGGAQTTSSPAACHPQPQSPS